MLGESELVTYFVVLATTAVTGEGCTAVFARQLGDVKAALSAVDPSIDNGEGAGSHRLCLSIIHLSIHILRLTSAHSLWGKTTLRIAVCPISEKRNSNSPSPSSSSVKP